MVRRKKQITSILFVFVLRTKRYSSLVFDRLRALLLSYRLKYIYTYIYTYMYVFIYKYGIFVLFFFGFFFFLYYFLFHFLLKISSHPRTIVFILIFIFLFFPFLIKIGVRTFPSRWNLHTTCLLLLVSLLSLLFPFFALDLNYFVT